MKKLNLLMAGLLLLGVSANAQERLYFNDFEDQGAQFYDSVALGTIDQIEYYNVKSSNGAHDNATLAGWKIEYVKDSTMVLYNAVAPLGSRGDTWTVEYDKTGAEAEEIESLGGEKGEYYFKYVAGEADAVCNNYEANLFVRAIPVQENHSYRVSYYVKTAKDAQVDVELMRGYYNSEKPFSMAGTSGSGEHVSTISKFPADQWTRITYMTYYTTDSIADLYMHAAGYWWSDSWLTTDPATGKEYNQIKQFDTFFLRFSFMKPNKTYLIDNIAVYNSWIGGAEYNGNIIRIDFGYDTNLAALVKAHGSTIVLDGKWINVTGYDDILGDRFEIPVGSCEYHDDGYMYIFLEEPCEWYEDIRIDFTNPDEEGLQLVYSGSLYPMANDTVWAKTKIVPNFKNEFVLPNMSVSASPWAEVAPSVVATDPDEGSFNLDPAVNNVYTVTFNKEVYTGDNGVMAKILGAGVDAYLDFVSYDEDAYKVTFKLPASLTKLDGDYEVLILNAKAQEESDAAPEFVINVSYGKATADAPIEYMKVDMADYAEDAVPVGFSVKSTAGTGNSQSNSSSLRIKIFEDGSEYTHVLYICSRTGSGKTSGSYGYAWYGKQEVEDDPALHLEPGEYYITYAICGWDKNSGDCEFTMYPKDSDDPEEDAVATYYSDVFPVSGVAKGDEGHAPVVGFTNVKVLATVTEEADYVLEWKTEYGYYAGIALANVMVTNKYSFAYGSIKSFNDAYEAAINLQAKALATSEKYSGADFDTFSALIKKYDGFTHTSPKKYEEVVAELKAGTSDMQKRMTQVDKFYTDLAAAWEIDSTYAAEEEAGLEAYKALVAVYEKYKDLSCPTTTFDDQAAINTEIENATKAFNDRMSAMETFGKNITKCEDIFSTNAALCDLAEYKAVQAAYNENKDLDLIACTDADLKAANDAIKAATDAFDKLISNANTLKGQLNKLSALAAQVGATFGETTLADLDAKLAVTLVDDQELAAIYKAGNTAAIYGMLAEGSSDLDGSDFTCYMQNPTFYTFATKAKIVENEEGKAFPGWTCVAAAGGAYVENSFTSFDGSLKNQQIGLDWNSSVTLAQNLTDLPAGKYTFGFSSSAWGTLSADNNYGGFYFNQYDADSALVATDSLNTWYTDKTFDFTALGGDVEVIANLGTTSTWAFVDNFTLTFNEKADVNYAELKEKADAKVAELIAGVKPAQAISRIEYYNLNGMRVATPQKGINIRVITSEDGMRSVEKILVK